MGISMADCRAGTIVWVQRKNGSWWPGRVLGLSELSPASLLASSETRFPVKLLGRKNGTVNWYNLQNSKRIKAFRCSEFENFIKRVEVSHVSTSTKNLKYANRGDAILHALELEKKELCKKRKMPERTAEEDHIGAICRSKRSRCAYLPAGSNNCLERTSFHAQPLQGLNGDSYQSSATEEKSSSRSSETYSSKSGTHNGERNEAIKQLSAGYDGQPGNRNYMNHVELSYSSDFPTEDGTAGNVEVNKRNVKQKLKTHYLNESYGAVPYQQSYISSRNVIHAKGDPSTLDAASKYHIRTGYNKKALENLTGNIYSPSRSSPGNPGRRTSFGTLLIDVKLTIQAIYRAENVPLVSLVSRLNGKAIIGHPVEIEKLEDGSTDNFLPKIDDAGQLVFDNIDTGTSLLPLIWRKARRTPVCYSPTPSTFSSREVAKPVQVCRKETYANLMARKNSSVPKQDLLKPLKKCILSNQNTTEPSFSTPQIYGGNPGDLAGQNRKLNWQLKPEETVPARATCVPVKLVTSKLLAAVGLQPEADIHN